LKIRRVPVGDARKHFNNKDVAIVKEGLRIEENNEKDLKRYDLGYINIFKMFLYFLMHNRMEKGDVLIQELQSIGKSNK
jgi:hypothetical protein